jgi:hypothetical protein
MNVVFIHIRTLKFNLPTIYLCLRKCQFVLLSLGGHVVATRRFGNYVHTTNAPKMNRLCHIILIIKANEMNYFSNLFDKVLYMFRTGPLSIIRSIGVGICYARPVGVYCVYAVLRYS